MKENIWDQAYSSINVSVKFLGIWWEFWNYTRIPMLDGPDEFLNSVKTICRNKFGNREYRFRFFYPDKIYYLNQK